MQTRVEQLQAEVTEQARLLGMSAERELSLKAKVFQADHVPRRILDVEPHVKSEKTHG